MHLASTNSMSGLAYMLSLGMIIMPVSLQGQDGGSGAGPDLVVSSIDVTPSTWMLGETVNIIAGVLNSGSDNSNSTTVDFFLSSDSTISTDDQLIGSDNVIPLQASEFWAAELSEDLQPDTGMYWIGACVQPDGLELDTSNNCSDGFEVTVTENTNVCIDLPLSCGNALSTSLSASDCDKSPIGRGHFAKFHTFEALLGTTVIIETTWSSDGYLYLEDPSGVVVAENDDDDGIFSSRIEHTLGSSGSWKIWATTFDVQDELSYEMELQCEDAPAPDLVVEFPALSSTEFTPGQNFAISATVRNQGDATSDTTSLIYLLSDDQTISDTDTRLRTVGIASLNEGDTATEKIIENAPDNPGTYWLGACVDEVPGESVTTNNCSAGAEVTVQSGESIPFNAGLNDAWSNSETNGQGFFIVVYPEIQAMFLAWFTFDTERPDASIPALLEEPGHRWLTAQGGYTDNKAVLDIVLAKGGVFDTGTPPVTRSKYGTMVVEFSNCNAGTVTYDIPSVDRQRVIPITRVSLDNVPLCEQLAGQSSE